MLLISNGVNPVRKQDGKKHGNDKRIKNSDFSNPVRKFPDIIIKNMTILPPYYIIGLSNGANGANAP